MNIGELDNERGMEKRRKKGNERNGHSRRGQEERGTELEREKDSEEGMKPCA